MSVSPCISVPPPIPCISNFENVRSYSDDSSLKVSDIAINLPDSIETWTYNHVIVFIVQLLCLPKALEVDIKSFIISRQIDGAKLAKLDEVELGKLGFNKLWCHHLSAAIEDLVDKGPRVDKEDLPLNHLTIGRKRGHRAQASVASIKKFGSFSRPGKVNYDTSVPSKPFSLPQVEIALVRHYMLSETAGMKEELGRLKKIMLQLSSKNTVLVGDIPISAVSKSRTPRSVPEEWSLNLSQIISLTALFGTLGALGFLISKTLYRK